MREYNSSGVFGNDTDYKDSVFLTYLGELTGYNSQQREFEQQEYLLEQQQNWSDERSRMQRMKEAGINPLTAAAGIAGAASSPTAPSVSSNTSGAIDALSGVAGAVNGGVAAAGDITEKLASAAKMRTEAAEMPRLNDAQIMSAIANAAHDLTESGLPEIDAAALGFSTIRNGLDGFGAIFRGDGIVRMIDKKMRQYDDEHDSVLKDLAIKERNIKMADINVSIMEKQDALTQIQLERDRLAKQRDELLTSAWERYNGDPYLPEFQRMYQILHDYGADSKQYQSILDLTSHASYAKYFGQYAADVDTGFDRAYNKALGDLSGEADFKPYLDGLDILKNAYHEFIKGLAENPKSIKDLLPTLIGSAKNAAILLGIRFADVDRNRPVAQPSYYGNKRSVAKVSLN